MIIVTGVAGFIGSCLVRKLNNEGFTHLVLVDDFSDELKNKNSYAYTHTLSRNCIFSF